MGSPRGASFAEHAASMGLPARTTLRSSVARYRSAPLRCSLVVGVAGVRLRLQRSVRRPHCSQLSAREAREPGLGRANSSERGREPRANV